MAKQVSEILIKLGLEGVQGLDKLKGAFRELEKSIGPNNAAIERARQSIIDYGRDSRNTEQVIKGQIDALRGLQSQVERGSDVWKQLNSDLAKVRQELRLTDTQITALRDIIVDESKAHAQSANSIREHVKSLQDLRNQASLNGKVHQQLGADIQKLTDTLKQGEITNREHYKSLGQILAVKPDAVLKQWQAYTRILQEGSASADKLATAQRRLNQLAGAPRILERRRVSESAAITQDSEYLRRFGFEGSSLPELPNTNTAYAQQIKELQQDLANLDRSSVEYLQTLMQLAGVQRQSTEVARGYAQALLMGVQTKTAANSTRNLQEVITALRVEMQQLDITTSEGSAAYATNANQVRNLEQQLTKLAGAYRHVGDAARSAEPARQGINPYTAAGARNPAYVLQGPAELDTAIREAEQGNINAIDYLLSAKRTMYEYEAQQLARLDGEKDRLAARDLERQREETAQADIAFKRELQRLDLLSQQRKAAASAMGLSGREDLSPLYRDITNLATASVRREQSMMGRSATQVLTDMFTAFDKGGRGVDIKQRSTQIGESIAQGITAGASDKQTLNSGADKLSSDFITALKRAFRIKSPSAESRDQIGVPIGQGIGKGIVKGLKDVKGEVVSAIRILLSDLTAAPQRAALPAQQTALSDKLQSFLARSSAKTSTFLPFARLMGEEAVSSPALTLAAYRRAYERGGIVPSMYMPIGQRRNVRGVSGIPGYGLEQEIRAAAVRNVSRTGAFVGPLGGPRISGFAGGALSNLGITAGSRLSGAPFAGQLASLFAASSPVPARGPLRYGMAGRDVFPVEGMLGGGRSLTLGRTDAMSSTREAIASYRKAIANFWEGESGTFETVRRIVSSGVQLSASRLAKRLTDTVELPTLSGIKSRIATAANSTLTPLSSLRTGDTDRNLNVWKGAAGYSNLGGFPISGMQQIGGVRTGGGSFVPMSGGGGGGSPRPPLVAAAPPPPPPNAPVPAKTASDYGTLTEAVSRFGSVSKRSTVDLREFSGSLRGLQEILEPTAADFQKVNRVIEKQGDIIDRELEERQRGRRSRITTGQVVQAAGAAISGGIFGGPEGFVGGVGGAILGSAIPGLGTVGGSFAGAAAGAQVGMIRQQLAGTTDYAAQIGKLQIALRGIVGTQQAYEQALGAAASATRELNIPQQEAIQGLTRLSAAVLGAGGTVTDSSFAFRAMSEAVKATGGNAEQVDGAMLALTQVFSKGKVSAEELNQIAERLPGTFTLFAEAAGKTGPELQKALEKGQVGLNDLMNFLMAVRDRYSATALTVASSSEEAGARLSVAFDAMRLAVGKALQPIGAELQDSLGKFITEITPGVVIGAKLIAAGFKGMLDTVKVVGSAIKGLSGIVAGLTKTLIVLGGVQAGIFVASNITTFTTALKGVVVVVRGLLSIEKALLAVESARAAVQAIIAGLSTGATKGKIAGAVLGGVAGVGVAVGLQKLIGDVVKNVSGGLDDTLKNYKADAGDLSKFNLPTSDDASKKAADKAAKDAQVAADQQQRLNETLMQQRIRMEDAVFKHQVELDKRRHDMQQERLDLEARVRISGLSGVERQMAADYEALRKELQQLENRNREAATAVRAAQQQLTAAQQMRSVTAAEQGPAGVQGRAGLPAGISGYITGDTRSPYYQADHGGSNYHEHISFVSRIAAEEAYKTLTRAGIKVTEFQGYGRVGRHTEGSAHYSGRAFDVPAAQVPVGQERQLTARVQSLLGFGNQGRLPGGIATQQRRATTDLGDVEVARLDLQAAQTAQRDTQQQTAALRPNLIKLSISESLQPLRDQNEELQKSINLEQQRIRLVAEGFGAKQIDHLMKINEKEAERAELIAATTQVYGADTEEANIRIAETNNLYDTQIQKLERLYEIQEAPGVALQERIGTLKAEIAELADYENVIISMSQTVEQSFATAIGSAVSSLVTGAASIKQVLADMFRSIGEAFIQMAAQIIAKQVVMITLQTILKALGLTGGFSGGGGGGGLGGVSTTGVPSYALPSGPGFASGFAMAKGGVVGANGIQPFANGGIVTKPTFFKYAKGGAMQNGLMGEAGPEAIMPLKRGADGKLGVAARLDGAMKRYRSTPGSAAAAAEGDSASLAAAGAATMEPIDVRYSVERINSIDYVSADQFERGMAEAAKQGALQGERRAMRSLKNSAATRKGVGL